MRSATQESAVSWVVVLTVALSAALAIAGAVWAELRWLHYVFKPLTTLLIFAVAWCAPAPQPAYRHAVLAGLLLSTLGDVWLMLPQDRFVFGLGSFLLAHLAYLYAFTRQAPLQPLRWPYFAYAIVASGVLALLWPRLPPPLQVPVVVYVVALAAMAAQAAVLGLKPAHAGGRFALAGGCCFVVSDALLAIDRFHTALPYAAAAVLTSYWLAQFLIARSVFLSSRATA